MAFEIPTTLITLDVRAPLCFLGQTAITSWLICATPKSSFLRPAILPVLAALAYCAFYTSAKFTGQSVLFSWFIVGPYANIWHCMNVLCLHPIDDFEVRQEMARWKRTDTPSSLPERVFFTTATLLSFRGIGTTWQISNVPSISGGMKQSRISFVLRQLAYIVIEYLIMDFFASMEPTPEMANSWAKGKEWLWIRSLNPYPVTFDDLVARAAGTTIGWFILGRVMNDVGYRIISVIVVGFGITSPQQWPPVFGNYSDCYTLRGYFGKFWHQLLRWPIQDVSSYITRNILALPRPSLVDRYTRIFLFFFISGTLHLLLDIAWGLPWRESGSIQCFVALALAVGIEDAAQALWRRVMQRGKKESPTWFERVVGYLWVWTALVVVSPIFSYPTMRFTDDPTYLMPFSIVKAIKAA